MRCTYGFDHSNSYVFIIAIMTKIVYTISPHSLSSSQDLSSTNLGPSACDISLHAHQTSWLAVTVSTQPRAVFSTQDSLLKILAFAERCPLSTSSELSSILASIG